jgi:hypothetical protein
MIKAEIPILKYMLHTLHFKASTIQIFNYKSYHIDPSMQYDAVTFLSLAITMANFRT